MNILIRNGRVVRPESVAVGDIWIAGEQIRAVEKKIDPHGDIRFDQVIDAEGMYVLPGIIDAHTHYLLHSRGTVTADGFYSGSVAGAIGGVTTAIDFADQEGDKSLLGAAQARIDASRREMAIDFGLHQCIFSMHENMDRQLRDLKAAGVTAVKIFTTYKREGYFIGESGLRELFRSCGRLGMMITAHCEDDPIMEEIAREYEGGPHPPRLHPVLRPAEAEYRAVRMLGELAGETDTPLYIVHLSSGRGLEAVDELRVQGVQLAVETTPHYLMLTNDLLAGPEAQKYIMTPPLREAEDNEALWQGLMHEKIQLIATDHCAFTLEQKLQSDDCRTVLPGIPGTGELLPLIYTAGVASGRFEIGRMVSLLSETPAQLFGLYPRKGRLQAGSDADLVLFDPGRSWTIRNDNCRSAAGYTPYDGFQAAGMPVLTMLRGRVIARDGEFFGSRGGGTFVQAGSSELFHD